MTEGLEYPRITREYVEARIQQWEQMAFVAEIDTHRAQAGLDYWRPQLEKFE